MDPDIRTTIERLSRPHPSGGAVVECAAILAAGGDYDAVLRWITEHGGRAEVATPASTGHGLHGSRWGRGAAPGDAAPVRFVLPPGAFA